MKTFLRIIVFSVLITLATGCAVGDPTVGINVHAPEQSGAHGEATEAPHGEATEAAHGEATEAPTHAAEGGSGVVPTATVAGVSVVLPTNPPTEVVTDATTVPTEAPTTAPTTVSTVAPTATVAGAAISLPTNPPTEAPTTAAATTAPTTAPTTVSTVAPTATVAGAAISLPTNPPTEAPTAAPTIAVTTAATETPAGELVKVTLFLGYIPNIQFAPVYMAFDQGFFKANGIDLTIEHGFDETDGLTRIASGKLDFGMISGEQVLLARSQGAAVKDIYRWYQKFPVGIVSLAKNNISKPEDLKGKKIGVPGLYGASYVGLQALLNAASLTEADLGSLEAIGFEPVPLICEGKIDASVVYISNEPAQIEKTCGAVNVIAISEYANIVSNGLVTSEKMLSDNPDLARRMVAAFDQGLAAVIADPELAYTVSRKYVETLSEDDSVQREVLAKSIEMWKAETLGISDPEVWKRTAETLVKMGLLPALPEVESAYSGEYLPK